jgi:hypothetical protein
MRRAILRDSELLIGTVLGVKYHRENRTEAYVSVPPALIITDSNGSAWSLGNEYIQRGLIYEFNVMCNDKNTGEMAQKIEYRNGQISIYGWDGRRTWTGRSFTSSRSVNIRR